MTSSWRGGKDHFCPGWERYCCSLLFYSSDTQVCYSSRLTILESTWIILRISVSHSFSPLPSNQLHNARAVQVLPVTLRDRSIDTSHYDPVALEGLPLPHFPLHSMGHSFVLAASTSRQQPPHRCFPTSSMLPPP